MSFLDDIFGPISDGLAAVFGIGKSVVSSIGSVVDFSSIASAFTAITSVVTSIDSTVNSLASDLHDVISPITSVVDSVANLGKDIENNVIAPIVTPITTAITQISSLTSTIDKLVDQGLQGILQIPKAISDALTGISTAFDNSTRVLGEANAKIASETLVPGITAAVAPGLAGMSAAFLKFSSPGNLQVDSINTVALAPDLKHDAFTDLNAFIAEHGKNPKEWYDWIFTLGYYLVLYATQLPAAFEPIIEEARSEANAANPVKLLDVGTLLPLVQRGIITSDAAKDEMLHQGLDPTRQAALLESIIWLPQFEQAGDWLRRGIIGQDQYVALVKAGGGSDADVTALLAGMKALLNPAILLDMVARGIIPQQEFDDQLKAQGYTNDQITAVIAAGLAPPQIQSLIAARGNLFAADSNFFASTYGAVVPDDIANAAREARIPVTQAAATWTSHWSIMPIQMAVNLFFRGSMSRDEVRIVVTQNNYPPDMTDLFIASQQEMLAPRTIPSLLARGAITEADARADLSKRGYSDQDVDLIVTDALAQAKAKVKPPPAPTTHLTVGAITEAYNDGVITQDKYKELLTDHGYSADEIAVTIALDEYKATVAQQKDLVATLKAEVSLGTKTPADVQAALGQANFTQGQIERVMVSLHQQKRATAKLPSLAEMSSMAKKSIITQDDLLAGVQALGYADPWDQRLVALVFTPGVPADGSTPA